MHCNEITSKVQLLSCFCVSIYGKDPNITIVGACMYTCCHGQGYNLVPTKEMRVTCLIRYVASDFVSNREGQLCGRCRQGFAPPAYSYDWR